MKRWVVGATMWAVMAVACAGGDVAAGAQEAEHVRTKPVLEVVSGQPQFREIVEGLGLRHCTARTLPGHLERFSCVVLTTLKAANRNNLWRLLDHVENGGGLVLAQDEPTRLPDPHGEPQHDLWPVSYVFPWRTYRHGVATAPTGRDDDLDFITTPDWHAHGDLSVVASVDCPLGINVVSGHRLAARKPGDAVSCLSVDPKTSKATGYVNTPASWRDLDEWRSHEVRRVIDRAPCEVLAHWRVESGDPDLPPAEHAAATLHRFGAGRVYWQCEVGGPDDELMRALFRAGIWRAATGTDLPADLRAPFPPRQARPGTAKL